MRNFLDNYKIKENLDETSLKTGREVVLLVLILVTTEGDQVRSQVASE